MSADETMGRREPDRPVDIVDRLRHVSLIESLCTTVDGAVMRDARLDEAADEIERLRAWKAEATAVINSWEQVYGVVPDWFRLGRLGETKSAATLAYVRTLL